MRLKIFMVRTFLREKTIEMPRKYKSKAVKFCVMQYDQNQIQKAIKCVQKGEMSINKAAEVFSIKRSTLQNKIKNKHPKKQGGQCALTQDEEQCLVNMLITTSNWGFPFTKVDLLDNRKTKVAAFKDNFPGEDWATAFMKRYEKKISQRTTQNITPAKAAISVESMSAYFDNLEKTIEGIPPENIANYDETNFTDDPGSKKAIFRRGIKYPENIMAHSKSSTSVMFCGTAAGVLLPLYVVYRAKYVYHTWVENGPPAARYSSTASGWFDGEVFKDWFKTVYIPFARKLPGTKVLIGDNLSSHFSEEVLRLAEKENIRFVCLPPNSTHVAQPLDVAFFRPLKRIWRKILLDFKLKHPKIKNVPKDRFPRLLKRMWDQLHRPDNTGKQNLKSGFRTCGIVPCDRRPVIRKIDKTVTSEDNVAALSEAVLTYMKDLRYPDEATTKKGRKRKISTAPGLSISAEDLVPPTISQPKQPRQSKKIKTDKPSQLKKPVKRLQKQKQKLNKNVGTDSDTNDSSEDDKYVISKDLCSSQIIDSASNQSSKRECDILKKPVKRTNQKKRLTIDTEPNEDTKALADGNLPQVHQFSNIAQGSVKRKSDILDKSFIGHQPLKRVQKRSLKNKLNTENDVDTSVDDKSVIVAKESAKSDISKKRVERPRRNRPLKRL